MAGTLGGLAAIRTLVITLQMVRMTTTNDLALAVHTEAERVVDVLVSLLLEEQMARRISICVGFLTWMVNAAFR
jgi:hypothetical protein